MIRHLLKLVWNRKRSQGLVILEIGISFLVVFAVAAAAAHFGGHWLLPLGFDPTDVWIVQIGLDDAALEDPERQAEQAATFETLLQELRSRPEIVAAAGADRVPYDGSTWTSNRTLEDGTVVEYNASAIGAGYLDALGIELVAGRDFNAEDQAHPWRAVIIDRALARTWFGEDDALGTPPLTLDPGEAEMRVVGVIDGYRKDGELAAPTNFLFSLKKAAAGPDPIDNIALRLAGPAPAGFEEGLLGRLRQLAPHWSLDIRSLDSMRDRSLTKSLAALAAFGVIALSLLLMVALGIVGVMWQNVTQRTREIGLRRACGASAGAIRRQVLSEMLLMAGIGVTLGVAVVIQLPILGWFAGMTGRTLALGLGGAAAAMLALTLLCGLYPSHLATAVQPAEALHHD